MGTNDRVLFEAIIEKLPVTIDRTANGHAVRLNGETIREFGRVSDARDFVARHELVLA